MARFDAVLFDLDGTLLDTAPDFYRVLLQIQQRHALQPVAYEALRSRASDGSRAMLKLAVGEALDETALQPLVTEFLDLYEADPVADGRLFNGINELLEALEARQTPWGIVTNKPRFLSLKVLRYLQLTERCATLICPEDVSQSKPSPEGLLLAAKQLKLEADRCLYLGDHLRDIEAGRAAGMTTIACGFGYLKPGELVTDWNADHVVNRPEELSNFICDLIA